MVLKKHNGHDLCDHKHETMAASLELMIHVSCYLHELILYTLKEGCQDVCSYFKSFPLHQVLPCQIPYTNDASQRKNLKRLDL